MILIWWALGVRWHHSVSTCRSHLIVQVVDMMRLTFESQARVKRENAPSE
jgi:hypothetical protein